MVTTRKGNKKTARSCDSTITTLADEGENNDPKRQRTNVMLLNLPRALFAEGLNDDSEEHQHQQAAAQDLAVSAIDEVVAVNNANELPTTDQLSQELCKIVSDRYSRDESLRALKNLYNWAITEDADFLKSFHTYGGIAKVLDFLKATMNDVNCKGSIRMKCIKKAAHVITWVTFSGENKVNKEIAKNIATTLIDCDGISTLINASEEYTGGDDIPQLKAMRSVWNAIRNITYHVAPGSLKSQDEAITIFDTGIDIMAQVKSVDNNIASRMLIHVFCTLDNIVYYDQVTKKYFQDKNILSKCLEVFKKNGAWDCRTEEVTKIGIHFFNICRTKNLLDGNIDYEMILPLLVVVLKKYPSNDEIRGHVVDILDDACSSEVNNKKTILRSGVMEPLGVFLASDEINNDEDEKNKVRTLISKIIA